MDTSKPLTIDEGNFEAEVTQSQKPVLVDFWAEWCGPCKMIAPVLDEIAKEKGDTVKVGKVDIDKNQNLSSNTMFARFRRCCSSKRPGRRSSDRHDKQEGSARPPRSARLRRVARRATSRR
jgi:thiol-disulfide isomerase/thioredoxin